MKRALPNNIVNPANCITSVRILGTVCLIFTAPLSLAFFLIYTVCGISDVLDGWVARKTNSITDFGSKLDSVADLFFYVVMIIKILPILWKLLPIWFWYVLGSIVVLRIASYTTAAIKFHRFASLHTKMNKISGGSVFLVPYALVTSFAAIYCLAVTFFGVAASIHELCLHLSRSEYQENHEPLI